MTDGAYGEAGYYLLVQQPRLARIPLSDGGYGEILFNEWKPSADGLVFMLEVDPNYGSATGETYLDAAVIPWGLLADRGAVEAAVSESATTSAFENGTEIVEPETWSIETRFGMSFSILNYGYSVEGEWLVFSLLVPRSADRRASIVDVARFPVSLTRPEDAFWFSPSTPSMDSNAEDRS